MMNNSKAAPKISVVLVIWHASLMLVWTLSMVLIVAAANLLRLPNRDAVPRLFHRGCCRILGFRVHVVGEICADKPCVYVANHISLFDIFSIGGAIPGFFVAKSEIATWPVFGALAKLQNTIFIERNPRHAPAQIRLLREHLAEGNNLMFFPEGTSTSGSQVAPFKSTLFAAAESDDGGVTVQPLTLAFVRYQGRAMTEAERNHFAWYTDISFLSHLANVMGVRGADLELRMHAPVKPEEFSSRKELAGHCESVVGRGLRDVFNEHADTQPVDGESEASGA